MRIGIFSKTFTGATLGVVLAAARRAGFSAAQYNMACSGLAAMPEVIDTPIAQAVAMASRESAVEIVAVSGTYNMIHPDPVVRAAGHARLEVLAAACVSLGTNLITLCTGSRDAQDQWRAHSENGTPQAWRDLLASMEVAVDIAERHGIDLGIEPELANVVSSAARARTLIDEIGSARLRVVLDPANLFEVATDKEQREIVARAVDLLADRISLGHAKDRRVDGSFTTAGRGVLDYPHYLACLKSAGFNGPVITHGLDEREADRVAQYLARACADQGIAVTGGTA